MTPPHSNESSHAPSRTRPTLDTGDGSCLCTHALLTSLTVRKRPYPAIGTSKTSAGPLVIMHDHLWLALRGARSPRRLIRDRAESVAGCALGLGLQLSREADVRHVKDARPAIAAQIVKTCTGPAD